MRIKGWSGLIVALLGVHVIALGGAAYAQDVPSIEQVSIGESGQQAGLDASFYANIRVSFDGDRVLFGSSESLVSDDMNGTGDGFVRIRSSQTTERVTFRADGSELMAPLFGLEVADMSSNGRHIVFTTFDDDVVEGDTKESWELFVRDVVTGEIELVSMTPEGLSSMEVGPIGTAAVSDDGNIIAFVSRASDLVSGDNNSRKDVFVRDRSKGETTLLRAPGTPRWWGGDQLDITPDGRFIVFRAYESIYRADLWTGEYELVSVDPDPHPLTRGEASDPSISADGRFVAYTWSKEGVVLRDMIQERFVIVGRGGFPSISADGRFIVFISTATDLGPDVSGSVGPYIYLYDAADELISLAGRTQEGVPIRGSNIQISGDGSTVVFRSGDATLAPGNSVFAPNVFAISLTTQRCAGMLATITGSGEIIGTDGDDVIVASEGSDSIYAGAGDDTICALAGGDAIDAGAGDDTIYAGSGNDVIYAGNGRDVVFGGKDDDIVNAGKGNDRAFGGPGIDIVRGNEGADRLSGGAGDDTLVGGPGTDRLTGGADIDTCKGSAGLDRYFLCEERLP